MESNYRRPDEAPRGDHAAPARHDAHGRAERASGAARPAGAHMRVVTRRGGDESYHAPEGNPHAAGTPRAATGYVSVVSEPEEGARRGHDRRRKGSRYAETDPYDLKGRRNRSPWKRAASVLSALLFVVGIGLIVVAGVMWFQRQQQYAEQDSVNEELATYVEASDDGETPPQVDWEGLKAVNDEVVGWIQIPGTVVNYPVYQTTDNTTYLTTSAEGTYTIGGAIFMDYENTAPGMVDAQTIIYGHHLRDGSMFKAVSDLQEQEMFDSVTVIWYVTETATYKLQPLLSYPTTADDTNVRQFNFDSVEEFQAYLTDLLAEATASRADAAEVIASTTQVLSLCTCYYEDGDTGRTVLVCTPVEVTTTSTDAETGTETEAEATAEADATTSTDAE